MLRTNITIILLAGILIFLGTASVNAQTDLNGTYLFQGKQGETNINLSLKFERKNAVYYSFEYKGSGTIGGNWTLENGIIKLVLKRGDSSWILNFKRKGSDLEVFENFSKMELEELPELKEMIVAAGSIFKKDLNEPNAPRLSTEEISKRVLKLTKSINGIKDISPENIERQMQIKVSFKEKSRNEYGFGGYIENVSDWNYNIFAYSSENNKSADTLRFSFDYQLFEPTNPDLSPVCKMDFDVYRKELNDAGFSKAFPLYGSHSRLIGWSFARNKTLVNITLNGGWQPFPRQCVKSLSITFIPDAVFDRN